MERNNKNLTEYTLLTYLNVFLHIFLFHTLLHEIHLKRIFHVTNRK